MENIVCSVCKIQKNSNEFSRISKSRLSGTCKKCQCEASKKSSLNRIEKNKKEQIEIIEKKCIICKEIKPINEFANDCRKIYGLSSSCKMCSCEKSKNFRLKIISGEIEKVSPAHEKKCLMCNEIKSIDNFSKDNGTKTGFRSYCKVCICKKSRDYLSNVENNKKIKEKKKEYRSKPETLKKERERYKNDIMFRLKSLMRGRLRRELRKTNISSKKDSTIKYSGCTVDFLYKWLEFQFDNNMNWDNMGSFWHIDHIIPCSAFNVEKDEDIIKCFHWTNIQPLEKIENLSKNAKIEQKYIEKLVNNVVKFNKLNPEFNGYQALTEMLKWLQVECRYGNNPIDEESYSLLLSKIGNPQQSSYVRYDEDMENVQRLDACGSEGINHSL